MFRLIEAKKFFGIDTLNEESISFSLLSTAVGYEPILKFLSTHDDPYLVPGSLKEDAVKQLAEWFFLQNSEGETVLGDSRNIQRLNVIIADDKARQLLIADKNLTKAFAATKGVAVEFNDLLVEINQKLSEAVAGAALVDMDEGHTSKINDILKYARALRAVAESMT